MYQEIIFSPHKIVIKNLRQWMVQKVLNLLYFLIFDKIKIIPVTAPRKNPKKSETIIYFQPRKAPIMAASFTSPPPIASFLKITEPAKPMINIIPPPASIPKAEFINDI